MGGPGSTRHCRCGTRIARDNTAKLCNKCTIGERDRFTTAPEVPAAFWEHEHMRQAFATCHMGKVIRAYRTHPWHGKPVRQETVARWLHLHRSQLSRVENDTDTTDIRKMTHWAAELGIPSRFLWFRVPGMADTGNDCLNLDDSDQNGEIPPGGTGSPLDRDALVRHRTADDPSEAPHVPVVASLDNMNRSEFLRAALGVSVGVVVPSIAQPLLALTPTPVPSSVGQKEIDHIRTTAKLFGTWDHTYGGGMVREAVAAQLRYSSSLLDATCNERIRADLLAAVGYLGHTAGFMAFDAYAHNDARAMFRFALACAEEANDWHLRAKILSSMARQEIWCGDPDTGLTLVELAMVRSDRLTPTERAMLLTARARALAKLKRASEATTTVGRADEQFAHSDPSNDPVWMAYYDSAQHAGDTGHALFDLALEGTSHTEAITRLTAAVDGHDAPYARSRAISGIKLASLTMRLGDPSEATHIGNRALTHVGAITSRRAADDLRELRAFATEHRKTTEVEQLRLAITQRVSTA